MEMSWLGGTFVEGVVGGGGRVEEYRPRITVDVTELQVARLRKLIPWGLRAQLLQVVIDQVLDAVEEHGPLAIAAILSKKLNLVCVKRSPE